jgi:regulator of replication initiation timing
LKLKPALAAITAVLIVSLTANVYFYGQQSTSSAANSSLQGQVVDLQSQVADLSNQTSSLQNEIADLKNQEEDLSGQLSSLSIQTWSLWNENGRLQSEKSNLQTLLSQLSQGKVAARLETRLGARDMRYNYTGSDIRLYISGEVWNVGTEPARNCRLHVTLYQGETVAEDTYIELGTINGGSYVDMARNIYYAGDALTRWTIIPEYD